MRHRILPGLALALALATLVVSPASAATTSFSATFHEYFGRSLAHPCSPPAFVCGEGTVAGLAAATSTIEIVDFANLNPATGCADTTLLREITLEDGSGALELTETGTVCFPGKSFFAPGASSGHSFGNPARIETTWTITAGTGAFAGASGSGTDRVLLAGDAGSSTLSGTITLP